MSNAYKNITTATTTEIVEVPAVLKKIVVNEDVASAVITVYDNITEGTLGADADGISTSQTPGAAGNLTITGALATTGVATLGYNRKVTITSAGNDSGRTFTITGTDEFGNAQTEDITGPNITTVTGTKDFLTVTQVAIDAASAGAITVGAAAESGTVVATVTSPATLLKNQNNLEYNLGCRNALTIVTSSTQDITVVYGV